MESKVLSLVGTEFPTDRLQFKGAHGVEVFDGLMILRVTAHKNGDINLELSRFSKSRHGDFCDSERTQANFTKVRYGEEINEWSISTSGTFRLRHEHNAYMALCSLMVKITQEIDQFGELVEVN